uniref:Uncharacterized protein n=1 Tax=Chromera velia CCMP2878 TaxID=1169474 RepID=A0A0G4FAV8_9ALVE|eukprot:Cvel_16067.t1-p1 / transcript=Cvel_16067.t1 / gene=Cvel_16067 / organism=Chromera_velia_CCMP2878 / gene_product=hypothetical protein / transcript_product=hypothetical protein / location=Cvel_scaffold1221:18703-28930(-) / protein_length=1954 / sequence_SO=supercontig / SO=protein_coding / is_pseudo=false
MRLARTETEGRSSSLSLLLKIFLLVVALSHHQVCLAFQVLSFGGQRRSVEKSVSRVRGSSFSLSVHSGDFPSPELINEGVRLGGAEGLDPLSILPTPEQKERRNALEFALTDAQVPEDVLFTADMYRDGLGPRQLLLTFKALGRALDRYEYEQCHDQKRKVVPNLLAFELKRLQSDPVFRHLCKEVQRHLADPERHTTARELSDFIRIVRRVFDLRHGPPMDPETRATLVMGGTGAQSQQGVCVQLDEEMRGVLEALVSRFGKLLDLELEWEGPSPGGATGTGDLMTAKGAMAVYAVQLAHFIWHIGSLGYTGPVLDKALLAVRRRLRMGEVVRTADKNANVEFPSRSERETLSRAGELPDPSVMYPDAGGLNTWLYFSPANFKIMRLGFSRAGRSIPADLKRMRHMPDEEIEKQDRFEKIMSGRSLDDVLTASDDIGTTVSRIAELADLFDIAGHATAAAVLRRFLVNNISKGKRIPKPSQLHLQKIVRRLFGSSNDLSVWLRALAQYAKNEEDLWGFRSAYGTIRDVLYLYDIIHQCAAFVLSCLHREMVRRGTEDEDSVEEIPVGEVKQKAGGVKKVFVSRAELREWETALDLICEFFLSCGFSVIPLSSSSGSGGPSGAAPDAQLGGAALNPQGYPLRLRALTAHELCTFLMVAVRLPVFRRFCGGVLKEIAVRLRLSQGRPGGKFQMMSLSKKANLLIPILEDPRTGWRVSPVHLSLQRRGASPAVLAITREKPLALRRTTGTPGSIDFFFFSAKNLASIADCVAAMGFCDAEFWELLQSEAERIKKFLGLQHVQADVGEPVGGQGQEFENQQGDGGLVSNGENGTGDFRGAEGEGKGTGRMKAVLEDLEENFRWKMMMRDHDAVTIVRAAGRAALQRQREGGNESFSDGFSNAWVSAFESDIYVHSRTKRMKNVELFEMLVGLNEIGGRGERVNLLLGEEIERRLYRFRQFEEEGDTRFERGEKGRGDIWFPPRQALGVVRGDTELKDSNEEMESSCSSEDPMDGQTQEGGEEMLREVGEEEDVFSDDGPPEPFFSDTYQRILDTFESGVPVPFLTRNLFTLLWIAQEAVPSEAGVRLAVSVTDALDRQMERLEGGSGTETETEKLFEDPCPLSSHELVRASVACSVGASRWKKRVAEMDAFWVSGGACLPDGEAFWEHLEDFRPRLTLWLKEKQRENPTSLRLDQLATLCVCEGCFPQRAFHEALIAGDSIGGKNLNAATEGRSRGQKKGTAGAKKKKKSSLSSSVASPSPSSLVDFWLCETARMLIESPDFEFDINPADGYVQGGGGEENGDVEASGTGWVAWNIPDIPLVQQICAQAAENPQGGEQGGVSGVPGGKRGGSSVRSLGAPQLVAALVALTPLVVDLSSQRSRKLQRLKRRQKKRRSSKGDESTKGKRGSGFRAFLEVGEDDLEQEEEGQTEEKKDGASDASSPSLEMVTDSLRLSAFVCREIVRILEKRLFEVEQVNDVAKVRAAVSVLSSVKIPSNSALPSTSDATDRTASGAKRKRGRSKSDHSSVSSSSSDVQEEEEAQTVEEVRVIPFRTAVHLTNELARRSNYALSQMKRRMLEMKTGRAAFGMYNSNWPVSLSAQADALESLQSCMDADTSTADVPRIGLPLLRMASTTVSFRQQVFARQAGVARETERQNERLIEEAMRLDEDQVDSALGQIAPLAEPRGEEHLDTDVWRVWRSAVSLLEHGEKKRGGESSAETLGGSGTPSLSSFSPSTPQTSSLRNSFGLTSYRLWTKVEKAVCQLSVACWTTARVKRLTAREIEEIMLACLRFRVCTRSQCLVFLGAITQKVRGKSAAGVGVAAPRHIPPALLRKIVTHPAVMSFLTGRDAVSTSGGPGGIGGSGEASSIDDVVEEIRCDVLGLPPRLLSGVSPFAGETPGSLMQETQANGRPRGSELPPVSDPFRIPQLEFEEPSDEWKERVRQVNRAAVRVAPPR